MDVHPLTQRIAQDAEANAQGILSEARARINDLQATSDQTIQQLQGDTQRRAQMDGDQLEQNLRRLGALDARKSLLALKRGLIDDSFALALTHMHALPVDQLRKLFMDRLVRFSKGDETVYAGAISDGFYDAAFLKEANHLLAKAGRPGTLRDGRSRLEGLCGLVLETQGTQTQLTAEAMIAQHRQALEGDVAQLVCGDMT